MTSSCLKHTCVPGTSQIFLDYLYHFDRVARFFDWDPFLSESFHDCARAIDYPADRRAAIVEALAAQNPGAGALKQLAQPETVAVVTGQQVGLFTGPAYTIYKAVTAARLARRLSDEGSRSVPVFWMATEDHDIAEVDHAWVFDGSRRPLKLNADLRWSGGPAGDAVLKDVPIEQLSNALDGLPYAPDVMEAVKQHYRSGATMGQAFKGLLKELLRDLNILFLDPLDPSIRRVAAPFLAEAVGHTTELMNEVQQRNRQLNSAGYHAQVHVEDDSSPLFLLEGGRRTPLRRSEDGFASRQGSYSVRDLTARAEQLSPNALLRPVMQDYLLPTVAYVGGPAEIAYMAQAQVVYRKLLGRMPVIVPRNGFTLLDHRSEKLMERFRLQPADLLADGGKIRERIAQQLVPQSIEDAFRRTRSTFDQELGHLGAELHSFDPTLAAALEKSGAKIRYQLEKLSRKTTRERLRRDRQAAADAEYLINTIYPHRHLQERFYTILPFLAQHGLDLVARLSDASRLECPDHMVRSVADLPALVYSN
jgi:bacillithiol biosynthesis cysteine-adding enzyme BshC